jgi:formylglycine-generating enzyme required for sulfatase activity
MSQCLNPNCNCQNSDPSLSFCSQGGFGRAFIGVDEALPSRPYCVIKQFFPADLSSAVKAAELFQQEAVRLDDLGKHPQIPTLFAHLEHNGCQYLIQEFVDGQDLLKELHEQGAFSEAKIRMLLADLLPVLQFIHDRNVIHRDIKPENIIRRRSNTSSSIATGNHVLVDFGAAKFVTAAAMMETGTRIGSAVYVAPEQVRGKAIFASDLYSLGVTCIHLLTNVSPFELMDMDGNWIWRDFLENTSISPILGQILDRMIVSAPSQRYQTAQTVLNDLKNLTDSSSQSHRPIFQRSTYLKTGVKTQIMPIASPLTPPNSQPNRAIAPQLSQFSFETAIVTVNRNAIGKFTKNQLQISTRQKIGKIYIETLGNVQGKPIGLEMVFIPAGRFQIGSPMNELEHSEEESPRHILNIPAFFMSRFPITQRQWKKLMDNNPSIFIGNGDRPVETVTWDDAQSFCQKLAQQTGRPYRLPSESEWEYACRAGTLTAFGFGETIAANLANYNGASPYKFALQSNSNSSTTEVGTYPANAFGLHDMHGNVWEWCADNWHDDYDLLPKDGSAWTQGGDRSCRVIRGGSWHDPAHYCRSAKRSRNATSQGDRNTGFRIAVNLIT